MTDILSKERRSEVMSNIRGRGNLATEVAFMRMLRRHKISGWRRHVPLTLPKLIGRGTTELKRRSRVTPDFVFRSLRVAVFIDGCFWHSCPRHATRPESNADFWHAKLAANRLRDRYVTRALRELSWTVLRIWEHDLRQERRTMASVKRRIARAAGARQGRRCL
jgi:DNA mismatch endonuclease, patch repair protein